MTNELLILIPGLSTQVPGKHCERLVNNLRNQAASRGGEFQNADGGAPDGLPATNAVGVTVFEYTPGEDQSEARRITLREVVWSDIPTRLSEISAVEKFRRGTSLLLWTLACLLSRPRVLLAHKYQSACIVAGLLILVLWYLGIVIAIPSALVTSMLPAGLGEQVGEALGAFGTAVTNASAWGINLWVATSFLMGLLPVTLIVDAAYSLKQYVDDERTTNDVRLVGEEVRLRISNALRAVRREQEAEGGPVFNRVTLLAYSFGAIPVVEALAAFSAPLHAPVRLITLGAPVAFTGALRPQVAGEASSLRNTGKVVGGLELESWHCIWSRWDYIGSNPSDLGFPGYAVWSGFKDEPIQGQFHLSLLRDHGRYFDDDVVASAIFNCPGVQPVLTPVSTQTHEVPARVT